MTPRDLLTAYDTAFRARFGRPCPPLGGKDARLAKSLIGRYDEADLRRWLEAFFKSRDSFIQGSTYSLGVFSSCLGKIIAADVRARVETVEDEAQRKADRARVEAEQEARWAAIREQQAREAAAKAAQQQAAEEAEQERIREFREARARRRQGAA